jgi:hypothetical protein
VNDPPTTPSTEDRRQAWDDLQRILQETHESASKSGMSQADIEQIIDAACEEVRYRTKPSE